MSEFKRILCPVDLSGFSMEALRLAVPLAKSGGAVLDILHVIHNPFDELYMSSITESDPAMIDAYAAEPARARQDRPRHRRARRNSAQTVLP